MGHVKGNGIGSILHVSGSHLAIALEKGFVFMWSEFAGKEWTDPTTCASISGVPDGPAERRNWECHFRPPTHCGPKHLKKDKVKVTENGVEREADRHLNFHLVELHHGILGYPGNFVPTELVKRYLEVRPHADVDEIKYWWRAQSVTYLMRLNEEALRTVTELRFDSAKHVLNPPDKMVSLTAEVPFPMGVIHSHVRHGDKYTEMTLQGTARYFDAGETLTHAHPWFLSRSMFVSTEDPAVLTEAKEYGSKAWSVVYTDLRRSNVGPLAQVQNLGEDNAGFTTRTHLLQLLMSLECDAWIGTRGSNWNRVLDELRCTWVDKCNRPYVEVGTDESWANYVW